MNFTATGEVVKIYEAIEQPTRRNPEEKVLVRDLVVKDTTNETYPQYVKMSFVGEKTNMLNNLSTGMKVKVACQIKGSEYADKETAEIKYATSVQGWRIELA